MKVSNRTPFFLGVATGMALMALVWAWNSGRWGLIGGVTQDSPNGAYSLSAVAALNPAAGGTYSLTLLDKSTGTPLRTIDVQVPVDEHTVGLREGGGKIVWDPTSTFVDISIGESDSYRINVP